MKKWLWLVSSMTLPGLALVLSLQTPAQALQRGAAPAPRGGAAVRGAATPPASVSVPAFTFSLPAVAPDMPNVPALAAPLTLNCSADLRWVNVHEGNEIPVPDRTNGVASINMLSVVGKPDDCLPAEIRLNVYYYDASNNLICSGVMNSAMVQTQPNSQDPASLMNNTMTANVEVRPYSLPEFFRWRNGPRPQALSTRRLICIEPDGLTEVGQEFDLATLAKVYMTLMPRGGGNSTQEIRLRLGF